MCLSLENTIEAQITKRFGINQGHPCWELESRLPDILVPVGKQGLSVNTTRLARIVEAHQRRLDGLQKSVIKATGSNFRISSQDDLRQYLFSWNNVQPLLQTPTGLHSVSAPVLERYADVPHIPLIRQGRRVRTALSYLESFQSHVRDGRIRTEFVLRKCPTGRIYTKDYNVQQVSHIARTCIVPDEGKLFLYLDYKQQEMRILLSSAQETSAYQGIIDGIDSHALTMSRMMNIPVKRVTKKQREIGKMLTYAMCYGMRSPSLGFKLGVSVNRADELMRQFFAAYPKIAEWIARQRQYAEEYKSVVSYFGYRRDLEHEFEKNPASALRMAVNTPIQSASATILKMAISNLAKLADKGIELTCAIVHDSILLQVRRDMDRANVENEVRKATEFQFPGWLPLQVEIGWGTSWAEASKKLPEGASL